MSVPSCVTIHSSVQHNQIWFLINAVQLNLKVCHKLQKPEKQTKRANQTQRNVWCRPRICYWARVNSVSGVHTNIMTKLVFLWKIEFQNFKCTPLRTLWSGNNYLPGVHCLTGAPLRPDYGSLSVSGLLYSCNIFCKLENYAKPMTLSLKWAHIKHDNHISKKTAGNNTDVGSFSIFSYNVPSLSCSK